jgi:glycosyltransferase involved in cell wall biosynthesis
MSRRALNILIATERFSPSIGGVETVSRLLGEAFTEKGHNVTVVTNQAGDELNSGQWKLLRRPGMAELLWQYWEADAVVLQGPTVRLGWPLFLLRRCALLVHHMRTRQNAASASLRAKLAACARHAAVSRALARMLPWPVEAILPNPYDECIFRLAPNTRRTLDIIFVGRLIPQKGAAVLLEAVARLKRHGSVLKVTIAGDGPQRVQLEELIAASQLKNVVRFAGPVTGLELAHLFQEHHIAVLPSVQSEAFGLIALEAIACGCTVVGSEVDGLPEAIGPCGMTFPAGDAEALAATLRNLLNSPQEIKAFRAAAGQHLAKHRPAAVAQCYLGLFERIRSPNRDDEISF